MADGGGSTADQWALAPAERELVMTKNRANWLGFAILLTFFRERGRFPRDGAEIAAHSIAGSCTRPLRIIILPPKPGKMPPLNLFWRGQGYGLTSFLLPTCRVGTRMALRYVACHWVQARPAHPTHASEAQAPTLHRAQTVCGPDAQAPLCVVCAKGRRDCSSASSTA